MKTCAAYINAELDTPCPNPPVLPGRGYCVDHLNATSRNLLNRGEFVICREFGGEQFYIRCKMRDDGAAVCVEEAKEKFRVGDVISLSRYEKRIAARAMKQAANAGDGT